MQQHLRKHITELLQLCSNALQHVSSPLLLLRTLVHAELAKCEELSDFVAKSQSEVERALALDYGSLEEKEDKRAVSAAPSKKKDKNTPATPVAAAKRPDELDQLRRLVRELRVGCQDNIV